MTSQHQPDPSGQPDTTCGAVRQNRSGTETYTTPCPLRAGHACYHRGRLSDGTWQDWVYADDTRASRGNVVAAVHLPPLTDERLAEILSRWAAEQADPDDLAGGQQ